MKASLRISILLMALCLLAGVASAVTVWNPPPMGLPPFYWGDPANWGGGVPAAGDKVVFNVPGAADCHVVGAQPDFAQLVQGDGGPGGLIRVMDSGDIITTDGWSAIGYNDVAHMIVDAGGVASFGGHLWVGLLAGSYGVLDISGTVNVAGMLGIGWNGGAGEVNVLPGGVLNLSNIHSDGFSSIKNGSLLSLNGTGVVTLPGDFESVIAAYAAAGLIAGDGILGNVETDLAMNPGFTTVFVPEPGTMVLLGLGGMVLRRRKSL